MSANIKNHVGLILASLVAIGQELTGASPGESPATQPPAGDGGEPKRRGRPPGAGAATSPAEAPPAGSTGKTYEELRELIKPLVEAGEGEAVKKIIAKYSTGGLKELEAKHHAAFEKDISALVY